MTHIPPSFENDRFEPLCELVLGRLQKSYDTYRENGGGAHSFDDVFLKIDFVDDTNENDYLKIARVMLGSEDLLIDDNSLASNPISPVIISMTFASRAIKAYGLGNTEQAWSCLVESSFWVGTATSAIDIGQNIKNGKVDRARVAAFAKNKKYDDIKSYAFKLVREGARSKRWPSKRNAAERISDDVNNFCESGSTGLRSVTTKTVQEWLARMPDAASLFQNIKDREKNSHHKQESQQGAVD